MVSRTLTDTDGVRWTVREVHRDMIEAGHVPAEVDEYLLFASSTGIRQFVPVPLFWRSLSDVTLLALLRRSPMVPGRRQSDQEMLTSVALSETVGSPPQTRV